MLGGTRGEGEGEGIVILQSGSSGICSLTSYGGDSGIKHLSIDITESALYIHNIYIYILLQTF